MYTIARAASQVSRRALLSRATLSMASSRATVTPRLIVPALRFYSAGPPPLTKELVTERVVDLLKCFDKIANPEKVTPTANFTADLGLDSLDVVECLFFIEEEFGVEMPDHEADEIKSVGQAVDWILAQSDAM